MRRLKIFAKGNADVFDTLVVCKHGDEVVWNGLNEALRERGLEVLARVQHETATGTLALIHPPATDGPVAAHSEALKPYPLSIQASQALFDTDADAIVTSIQPDVAMRHLRSLEDGGHLYLGHPNQLGPEMAAWLGRTHALNDLPDVAETFDRLSGIVARIRARTQAPILIYNTSPLDPGPITHCYLGLEDSFATRVRRFNLMLIELSEQTGVSIVDVESVVAKAGADRLKLDVGHLSGDGARLVAHEVARVLEDYGLFDADR